MQTDQEDQSSAKSPLSQKSKDPNLCAHKIQKLLIKPLTIYNIFQVFGDLIPIKRFINITETSFFSKASKQAKC